MNTPQIDHLHATLLRESELHQLKFRELLKS